jgi:TonB family protein
VIRGRVAASGCATGFAIAVGSGYPDLERAALEVAEACQFSAATENGQPIDSQMNFKVSFRLKQQHQK